MEILCGHKHPDLNHDFSVLPDRNENPPRGQYDGQLSNFAPGNHGVDGSGRRVYSSEIVYLTT